MVIDVEDGDSRPSGGKRRFGADRRIVQVRIAAEVIGAGVVPRWAAEREDRWLAVEHAVQRSKRRLSAPIGGAPRALGYRRRRVEAVSSQPRIDPLEVERTPAGNRERVGQGVAV